MLRPMLYVFGAAAVVGTTSALLGLGRPASPAAAMLNPYHQCSYCHATHDGQGGDLLIDTDVEVLCLTCHGPGGTSMFKAKNHKGQTCTLCHEPHDGEFNRFGSRNLKMMRSEVVPRDSNTARPLTFESRGTDVGEPTLHSFCDDDEDNDQIWDNTCDTCHDDGDHSYNDPNSHGHNTGRTCTVCHLHSQGFEPDD